MFQWIIIIRKRFVTNWIQAADGNNLFCYYCARFAIFCRFFLHFCYHHLVAGTVDHCRPIDIFGLFFFWAITFRVFVKMRVEWWLIQQAYKSEWTKITIFRIRKQWQKSSWPNHGVRPGKHLYLHSIRWLVGCILQDNFVTFLVRMGKKGYYNFGCIRRVLMLNKIYWA